MRRTFMTCAVLLSSLLLPSGCAVVFERGWRLGEGKFAAPPYVSTRTDVAALGECVRVPDGLSFMLFPLGIIDLPISFTLDTAFLPIDAVAPLLRDTHHAVEPEPARDRS
jgi:uncharacterized protein YceK